MDAGILKNSSKSGVFQKESARIQKNSVKVARNLGAKGCIPTIEVVHIRILGRQMKKCVPHINLLHNLSMNILQTIFREHYEEIIYTLHLRQVEPENITRLVDCGQPDAGGTLFCCPHCGTFKFVPFHCHSRFCPSCGTLYAQKRTTIFKTHSLQSQALCFYHS